MEQYTLVFSVHQIRHGLSNRSIQNRKLAFHRSPRRVHWTSETRYNEHNINQDLAKDYFVILNSVRSAILRACRSLSSYVFRVRQRTDPRYFIPCPIQGVRSGGSGPRRFQYFVHAGCRESQPVDRGEKQTKDEAIRRSRTSVSFPCSVPEPCHSSSSGIILTDLP